jgi:protease-4
MKKLRQKIWRLIKSFCAVLGGLVLIAGIGTLVVGLYNRGGVYVPENSALTIDFSHHITEVEDDSLLAEISEEPTIKLSKLIQSIELAAHDNHIKALVARLDTTDLELAQVQDIARAVAYFRGHGKKAYVFSQGFGPLGQGNREYYLATFFDKIYMQPHTTIGLTGIAIEVPFVRTLLDKLGIEPEFFARYEYKTAMMSLTDKNMSASYRQDMNKLAQGLSDALISGIEQNRQLKDVKKLINQAPFSAEKGIELGLIDGILYLPELEDNLRNGNVENYIDIEDYAKAIKTHEGDLPVVAYLTLSGVIDKGESSSEIDGEFVIGSKSVASDIAEISDLPNLKAVIVRIDSPGGDYNASDEIYHALQNLKKTKHVPIIVSMSGYAASGGYYIALAGDKIIAEPTTITGSIGVLGGKVSLQQMWQKIGINWNQIKIGQNADILSINKPFSTEEKRLFNASLDEVYADFTQKVIENRHLKININDIARGRVWLGWQALEVGLVDMLGGYAEALDIAKQEAGLSKDTKFILAEYPRTKSFSEKISELLLAGQLRERKLLMHSGVDIRYLKLFKRLQYDTVLPSFIIDM